MHTLDRRRLLPAASVEAPVYVRRNNEKSQLPFSLSNSQNEHQQRSGRAMVTLSYQRRVISLCRYSWPLVRIPVTQRPALCIEDLPRRYRCALRVEMHLMICVRVNVVARAGHIVRGYRHPREGSKVRWGVVLPLFKHVSNILLKQIYISGGALHSTTGQVAHDGAKIAVHWA